MDALDRKLLRVLAYEICLTILLALPFWLLVFVCLQGPITIAANLDAFGFSVITVHFILKWYYARKVLREHDQFNKTLRV